MSITHQTSRPSICLATCPLTADRLLEKEYLLTNRRGAYSSSTVIGCNTRRYHGLLIGSLNPPVSRITALSQCLETVAVGPRAFNLSTFEFAGKLDPAGFRFVRNFRRDIGVHFDYQLEDLQLTKSIYLSPADDLIVLEYDFIHLPEPALFSIRPFVALRDFHSLQRAYADLCLEQSADWLLVRHDTPESCKLLLSCPGSGFQQDSHWWYNFVYRADNERGQNFTEDLWTPGLFKFQIQNPAKLTLFAQLIAPGQPLPPVPAADVVLNQLLDHHDSIIYAGKPKNDTHSLLLIAADQFVTARQTAGAPRTTILAGYPWFADWGRDAFISLPGLLLATGRFQQAQSVLTTFAQALDEGMIPNRFDDYSDTAYFNTVDASLWFINAAFQYLAAADDLNTFEQLLPVIRSIVDFYAKGTKFDTHADTDGLITAGAPGTQLTWMDAKCEGVAFTPRYGKAVEINALWHNSLRCLAQFFSGRDAALAEHYKSAADKVQISFQKFWNSSLGCLYDCLLPDGRPDTSLRPNQIFAVSLGCSPLPPSQQLAIVDVVHRDLLTPFGLRSLSPADSHYKGIYSGPQFQRDQAYHQGTVWAYLIGPFVEAFLKVNSFSPDSRKTAAGFIQPLIDHLTTDGCLGSVSEIFDGDSPHKPKGCFAQAWSVAELIRAYLLINS